MYRGVVTKVDLRGVYVRVADVSSSPIGPCEYLGSAPTAGDRVLVADVSASPVSPDLIVIGVLS